MTNIVKKFTFFLTNILAFFTFFLTNMKKTATLFLQVGHQAATDVFPRGEGGGEGDFELIVEASDDEVVGVDVTWLPRVEGQEGLVGELDGDGDVGELLVLSSCFIVELEADGHLDVLLRELHLSAFALHEEGGGLRLALAEVVAFDVLASIELEEWRRGQVCGILRRRRGEA